MTQAPGLGRNAWLRIAPFALLMLLYAMRRAPPPEALLGVDPRWVFALGVLVLGAALGLLWREYGELARQNRPSAREAALAAAVGVALFGLVLVLDAPWMVLRTVPPSFVPVDADGRLEVALAATYWLGLAAVAPLIEELFWRSFLMRWFERPQFDTANPRNIGGRAIVLSTFVYVLAHPMWLAATVAGFAYALLYVGSGRLWTAVIAHAVANAALGAWVIATRQWSLW